MQRLPPATTFGFVMDALVTLPSELEFAATKEFVANVRARNVTQEAVFPVALSVMVDGLV